MRPGIEPRSSGLLANTLPIWPMSRLLHSINKCYFLSKDVNYINMNIFLLYVKNFILKICPICLCFNYCLSRKIREIKGSWLQLPFHWFHLYTDLITTLKYNCNEVSIRLSTDTSLSGVWESWVWLLRVHQIQVKSFWLLIFILRKLSYRSQWIYPFVNSTILTYIK